MEWRDAMKDIPGTDKKPVAKGAKAKPAPKKKR